ncbi:MAG TPA: phosphatase PAP2 family protein [Baekduia sp.]|nr:phosphatase PAP2 family protein [Baekduia sp.]
MFAKAEEHLFRALRVSPELEKPLAAFSKSGEHAAVWLALGLTAAALDRPRRSQWLKATGVVGGSYLANIALKYAVRRKRPEIDGFPALTSTVTSLSFPSAHATTAFAAARTYSALVPAATAPLYVAAIMMALSRVSLGVHYPSDIVAGAALGTVIGEALQ